MWLQPVSRLLNWTGAGCSRCELDELVPVHKQQTDLIPFSAVTHPPRRPAGDSVSCEPDPGWVSKPLHKGRLHVTPGPLAPSQISPTSPRSRSCWHLWVDLTSVCLCVCGEPEAGQLYRATRGYFHAKADRFSLSDCHTDVTEDDSVC